MSGTENVTGFDWKRRGLCMFSYEFASNQGNNGDQNRPPAIISLSWLANELIHSRSSPLTSHLFAHFPQLHRTMGLPLRWMNEFFLYIEHKKLPHKTLRVHSARYTQCIHVSSRKLKLPKDTHTKKYKQLLPTHPFPKVETIHSS